MIRAMFWACHRDNSTDFRLVPIHCEFIYLSPRKCRGLFEPPTRILLVSVYAFPFFFPCMCTCACHLSCNVLFSNLYFHYVRLSPSHNLLLCYSHVSIDYNAHQCTDHSYISSWCPALGRSASVHLEEHVAAVAYTLLVSQRALWLDA